MSPLRSFFHDAAPGFVVFSLQIVALLVVALAVYLVRRKRSPPSPAILPVHQAQAVDEKTPGNTELALAEEEVQTIPRSREWLPPNHFDGANWLAKIAAEADTSTLELHEVLEEFKSVIENDPIIYMLFTRMFQETPQSQDPVGRPEVHDYQHMLRAFNVVLSMGPPWAYTTAGEKGAIGAPITAIINWPMGTKAGREAFLNPIVNTQIKNVLNAWGKFLTSPASATVLNPDTNGWLCEDARKTMADVATIHTHSPLPAYEFEHLFPCDPTQHTFGFQSWDDFFTRRFAPHVRPVAQVENNQPLIVSACESAPYRIASPVQERAQFWLKSQPYSLVHMLANSDHHTRFINGTIYQAYLSALSYHRWHAPVSGTIVKIDRVPGTYFAENYREPSDPHDPVGPIGHVLRQSQAYISEVAARMIVYIEADDPRIGFVAAIFIGMVEVSSCEATVQEAQHVHAGQEIGMFHYGGSSYCLLFEGGKKLQFVPEAWNFQGGKNFPVNARLATVVEE